MPSWACPLDPDPTSWLLTHGAPWVRYRTLLDLLDRRPSDPQVVKARQEMVDHPSVRDLVEGANRWPGQALERHNDARHLIHKLTVLADFGLRAADPGMSQVIAAVRRHRSADGAFQTLMRIPKAFGGSGVGAWSWLCDTPALLYALASYGLTDRPEIQQATDHLVDLGHAGGWLCTADPGLRNFRGPGRRGDPCPLANLLALKALSLFPHHLDSAAARAGIDMLLGHWEHTSERRYFLFGAGSRFRLLKVPYIWFDLLHVAEVLTRFPAARQDARLAGLIQTMLNKRDGENRFTPESIWMAWSDWEFGQKRQPSPWLTFLILRILKRLETQSVPAAASGASRSLPRGSRAR